VCVCVCVCVCVYAFVNVGLSFTIAKVVDKTFPIRRMRGRTLHAVICTHVVKRSPDEGRPEEGVVVCISPDSTDVHIEGDPLTFISFKVQKKTSVDLEKQNRFRNVQGRVRNHIVGKCYDQIRRNYSTSPYKIQ
jgi:hypothetical protein